MVLVDVTHPSRHAVNAFIDVKIFNLKLMKIRINGEMWPHSMQVCASVGLNPSKNHKKNNQNPASEPEGSSLAQNWTSYTYNGEMWPHSRQACASAGLDPSRNHRKKNTTSKSKGSLQAQNWTSVTYNGPFVPVQASTLQGITRKKQKPSLRTQRLFIGPKLNIWYL